MTEMKFDLEFSERQRFLEYDSRSDTTDRAFSCISMLRKSAEQIVPIGTYRYFWDVLFYIQILNLSANMAYACSYYIVQRF